MGAERFVYHEVFEQGHAADSVGRKHPLVTISYQGVVNTDDTINRTGFFLPAKPTK